jgi:hypothetical protein
MLHAAHSPFFALPDPRFISYGFEPSFVLPFAIASLASPITAARRHGAVFAVTRTHGVFRRSTTCTEIGGGEYK